MHCAKKFEPDGRAERDEALAAALRREGLELLATVTLDEIERRWLGAEPAHPRNRPATRKEETYA